MNCAASRTKKTGGWCAGSTTTCARRSKSPRRGLARRTRFAAAGAMMAWWNCSAARRRQKASASRSAPTGAILRFRRAATAAAAGAGRVSRVVWRGGVSRGGGLARKLRDAGFAVELPAEEMKFKKSLGLADKLGARYAVIIGEDEVASGTYTLKRLADARAEKVQRERIARISGV